MHPSIHASVHSCLHPPIYASIHHSFHGSIHRSTHPSIFPHASIHASMNPCIRASMHPCIHGICRTSVTFMNTLPPATLQVKTSQYNKQLPMNAIVRCGSSYGAMHRTVHLPYHSYLLQASHPPKAAHWCHLHLLRAVLLSKHAHHPLRHSSFRACCVSVFAVAYPSCKPRSNAPFSVFAKLIWPFRVQGS